MCVRRTGDPLGRINTEYTRHHILVDWDGDGLQEIGSALPRALFDGHGRCVCHFTIGEDERPRLMAAVDLIGHGPRDVLLTAMQGDTYKVYLYRNRTAEPSSDRAPSGTGRNFTLY